MSMVVPCCQEWKRTAGLLGACESVVVVVVVHFGVGMAVDAQSKSRNRN